MHKDICKNITKTLCNCVFKEVKYKLPASSRGLVHLHKWLTKCISGLEEHMCDEVKLL